MSTSFQGRQIDIRLAATEKEKRVAGSLRQKVFGDELCDNRYSKGSYQSDRLDEGSAEILVAYDAKLAIATLRLTCRREDEFIKDASYEFPRLATLLGIPLQELLDTVFLIDRTCVLKEYRRKGLFSQLETSAEQRARAKGGQVLVSAIATGNTGSQKAFESKNWVVAYPARSAKEEFQLLYKRI